MTGSLRMDSLFILLIIGCVIAVELCKLWEFCVLNNGIIVGNDCFEMKYELGCGYYYILLSIKIDTATGTLASTVHFNLIGIRSCHISRIRRHLFCVLSPSILAATISIECDNEMKYESGTSQTQHATPHPPNKGLDIDPTDAALGSLMTWNICLVYCQVKMDLIVI